MKITAYLLFKFKIAQKGLTQTAGKCISLFQNPLWGSLISGMITLSMLVACFVLSVHCAITRTVTVCLSLISTLQSEFWSRILGGRKKLIFKWSVCGIFPTGMVGVILKVYSLLEHSWTVNTEGETWNKKWMIYKISASNGIIESACSFWVNYKPLDISPQAPVDN